MQINKDRKVALLFGASGMVGGFCLELLLASPVYSKVIVFGRRKMKVQNPKLEQHIIDFDRLNASAHLIKGDDLYCTLGSTMAKAGSKEAFFKVDYTYVYEIAQLAQNNQVNQFLLVTAVGADPDSLFFYNRVKGQLEKAIKSLPFWAIHIFQPSILLGERNENRWGEALAIKLGRQLDRVLGGFLSKYRPIEGQEVAKAMLEAAQRLEGGIFTYASNELVEMGQDNNRSVRK